MHHQVQLWQTESPKNQKRKLVLGKCRSVIPEQSAVYSWQNHKWIFPSHDTLSWGNILTVGFCQLCLNMIAFLAISPWFFDIFSNGLKWEEMIAWLPAGNNFLADQVNRQTQKQHLLKSCKKGNKKWLWTKGGRVAGKVAGVLFLQLEDVLWWYFSIFNKNMPAGYRPADILKFP